MVVIVMGVSGSGKTTIGKKLAAALGWEFFDGDDYHPPANIEKMSKGIPLNDDDRQTWLELLRGLIEDLQNQNKGGIIASSALKASYRDILINGDDDIAVIYLRGSYDLIWERMKSRQGHYMKANMLKSQFDALQEPDDAIIINITDPPDEIVQQIIKHLPRKTDA